MVNNTKQSTSLTLMIVSVLTILIYLTGLGVCAVFIVAFIQSFMIYLGFPESEYVAGSWGIVITIFIPIVITIMFFAMRERK